MGKCKNCGKEFQYCVQKYTDKLGTWGTYACCQLCAESYVEKVLANRTKSKINIKLDEEVYKDTVDEIVLDGANDMQYERLSKYKKQDEVIEFDTIDEVPKTYPRRRKNT